MLREAAVRKLNPEGMPFLKTKRPVGRPPTDQFPVFVQVGDGIVQRLAGQETWSFRAKPGNRVLVGLPEQVPGARWTVSVPTDAQHDVRVEKEESRQDPMNRRVFDLAMAGLSGQMASVVFTLTKEDGGVLAQRQLNFVR